MTRISQLTSKPVASTDDQIEIVDTAAGNSKKTTVAGLAAPIAASLPAGSVTRDALGDSGWINLTPASGHALDPTRPARVRKIGNVVYIDGQINRGSGTIPNGTVIGVVPEGYRPSGEFVFISPGPSNTVSKIIIVPGGFVYMSASTGSPTYARLDNSSYLMD